MREELNRCECAKSEPLPWADDGGWWTVFCWGCEAETELFQTEDEAIAAWNRRAEEEKHG